VPDEVASPGAMQAAIAQLCREVQELAIGQQRLAQVIREMTRTSQLDATENRMVGRLTEELVKWKRSVEGRLASLEAGNADKL